MCENSLMKATWKRTNFWRPLSRLYDCIYTWMSLKGKHILCALFIVHIEQYVYSPPSGTMFYNLMQLLPSPLHNLSEMEKSSVVGMDDCRGSSLNNSVIL